MFTNDFTKMFDAQNMSQNMTQMSQNMSKAMQQIFDVNQALTNSKKNLETVKKLNTIWADTCGACAEKQLKMYQSTLEDSIECMRELSTSKGIEDYVAKQAEWSRKWAEKCQSNAQELTETVQKGQTQCNDVISKLMSQNLEYTKETVKAAANTASSATNGK